MENKDEKLKLSQIREIFIGLLPKKRHLIIAMMILLIENGLSVGLPYVIMRLIDKVKLQNIDMKIIVGVVGIMILQMLIATLSAYLLTYIAEYIIQNLRKNAIKDILHLPVAYFDENQTGNIMSLITNDTMQVRNFITKDANYFISEMIILVGSIALIFFIDVKIGLVVSLLIPLSSTIVFFVAEHEYGVSIALQHEIGNFQSSLNRVFSEIRLVKSYVAEKKECENCNEIVDNLYNLSLKEGKIMSLIRPFSNCIMLLLFVTVFGYGSLRVSRGTLTAGALIAIIMYVFQISSPVSSIASFYAAYNKFSGSLKRLHEIDELEAEGNNISLVSGNGSKDLRLENVCFEYNPSKQVLKNISFQIEHGEKIAIIGKSGVGKTTIFSLLERYYVPTSGRICYDGKDISYYDIQDWRRKIAYVSQDSPIMYGTILSNLTYGLDTYTDEQVKWALEQARLGSYVESLPDGYNTLVGERGVKLSGGQRQRLAIARAFLRNPEVLLLDEATSHLDSDSEKLVKESLDVLMKGRTVIMIAHNLSTVRNVDRLIVLQDGKISGMGNHVQLLKKNELYKRFIEQQCV